MLECNRSGLVLDVDGVSVVCDYVIAFVVSDVVGSADSDVVVNVLLLVLTLFLLLV